MTTKKLIIILLLIGHGFAFAQTSIKMDGKNSYVKREFIQNSEKFTFAIIGDKTNGGELNWPIFDRAIEEINLLQPDFAIMIGDMIQGVTTDTVLINKMWKEFKSHAEKLTVPLYLLPGNHDISNEVMYDYWNEKIGLRYYSFVKNNSLFIILNTEEYRKTEDGAFGKEQLNFVMKELETKKEVDQTFILFHRPVWLPSDSKHGGYDEWQKIQSWIKNRNTTIFAGHWHRLLYNKIDGHKQIILSATGGSLDEKLLPQLGYFHHYSIVTVDGDSSKIAIIKPGNIFPETISNKEFTNKFDNILKINSVIEARGDSVILSSKIVMDNLLDKSIEYTFKIMEEESSTWNFNNNEIVGSLKPNETVDHEFFSSNSINYSIPFPTIKYVISINGKVADKRILSFAPSNDKTWRSPQNVMVLGGFDLGFSHKPRSNQDVENTILNAKNKWADEQKIISSKINDRFNWQEAKVIDGTTTFDNKFDRTDFAFGYMKFVVESDEAKVVLASLRPDNYGQVYLNGKVVLAGSPFKGVPSIPYMFLLNLQKGENIVVLKTANYFGSWYTDFKISDAQNKLLFKINK